MPNMLQRSRRLVARVGALAGAGTVVVVLGLVSCGLVSPVKSSSSAGIGSGTSGVAKQGSFDSANYGLRFDYPGSWRPQRYEMNFSFSSLITYLSPQQTHDPCTRSANEISCWDYSALQRLDPDSVLINWSAGGFPTQDVLSGFGGSTTSVGGHRAKIEIQHNPAGAGCGQIGGDELITAAIDRGVPGNDFVMTACFRGPALVAIEHEVQSMLDSVTIAALPGAAH